MELDFNKLGDNKIHWRSYDLANAISHGDSILRGSLLWILIASNPFCPINRGTLTAEYSYRGGHDWSYRGIKRYINEDGILRLTDLSPQFKVERLPTKGEIIAMASDILTNEDWTIVTPLRIFRED